MQSAEAKKGGLDVLLFSLLDTQHMAVTTNLLLEYRMNGRIDAWRWEGLWTSTRGGMRKSSSTPVPGVTCETRSRKEDSTSC